MKQKPCDIVVHLGDVTGGYQEKGSNHSSVKSLARKCMDDLRKLSKNVRVCVGNHDIGYESGLPFVTITNFRTCEEIFGNLFWSENAGEFLILGLCSSLLTYDGNDKEVLSLKENQKKFISDSLDNWKRIVICVHDVYSLKHLSKELMPNLHKVEKIIFGDLHHPSSHTFAKTAFRMLNLLPTKENFVMMQCLNKSICCPSSAPLWWNGGSYLEADFNGSMKIEQKSTGKKSNAPTSSFVRCYYWGRMH